VGSAWFRAGHLHVDASEVPPTRVNVRLPDALDALRELLRHSRVDRR
jgi:hypothetical protein